ncbi:hypothetical protein ABNU35_14900 [Klebsiella pneumoniae]
MNMMISYQELVRTFPSMLSIVGYNARTKLKHETSLRRGFLFLATEKLADWKTSIEAALWMGALSKAG